MRYFPHMDARGWIGLGCFTLVLAILAMIAVKPVLLENDAFLILATALVVTGWVNGPVGWAYQATKGGGELADRNANMLADQASGKRDDPVHTKEEQVKSKGEVK